MALVNNRLKNNRYNHYDRPEMKKSPSGISPAFKVSKEGPEPLYRQVYEGFREAIEAGYLQAGQRVPSTRILALELRISRMPVLTAYAQLLAEGYFESRVGSGTVVSRSLPEYAPKTRLAAGRPKRTGPEGRPVSRRCWNVPSAAGFYRSRAMGPFSVSQIAFEDFPLAVWNRLVTRQARNTHANSLDYGDPLGLQELREAIATYLRTARGVRCEPGQILIVNGSQQGLEIAVRVLLDRGSRVWMEEPGYRFAHGIFGSNGCRMVPVPVDAEGLNVAAGIRKCRSARAALVTPSHQYPLGMTMSASRRLQLLDWAERNRSWIIEDDYDSEFRYEGMPVTSLQGLDANDRVVYIGTFSKVLFPSLRLGYVVVPRDLIERFLSVRFAMDIGPSTFLQSVLADFLREGHFSRHIRRMRHVYGERQSVLRERIHRELGEAAEMPGGPTGLHLSVLLNGISDREIAKKAARRNLSLVPLSSSYLDQPARQGFILGFGSTRIERIPAAVRALRLLVKEKG